MSIEVHAGPRRFHKLAVTAAATGLALLSTELAWAADVSAAAPAPANSDPVADSAGGGDAGMAEITVSGNKDDSGGLQSFQNVPRSISVLTGADLQLQDAVDMGSITRRAANVK